MDVLNDISLDLKNLVSQLIVDPYLLLVMLGLLRVAVKITSCLLVSEDCALRLPHHSSSSLSRRCDRTAPYYS